MDTILTKLLNLVWQWFSTRTPIQPERVPTPTPIALAPVPVVSVSTPAPVVLDTPKYLFDTAQNARHSVRVLCDEEGLSLDMKNTITACIEEESQFYNYLPDGRPTKHINILKDGTVGSIDWGICQINDYYQCGIGKPFKDWQDIMDNPDKAVRFMIAMSKVGELKLWVSYSSGRYRQYMPQ